MTAIVGQLSDKDERVVINISVDQLQKIWGLISNLHSNVGHGNIKSRQHCNCGGIYLNTVDSKILASGFILALSRQTRQRISREIDAFNEDTFATESNSKFTKNS